MEYKWGYGIEPEIIKNIPIEVNEMMFYMYLPIMINDKTGVSNALPKRLHVFAPLIDEIGKREDIVTHKYMYITAKHVYVTPDNLANRPGWHCDGFMTDDINYIWMDKCPTEFLTASTTAGAYLPQDDVESLKAMQDYEGFLTKVKYKENDLIRLTESHIHRVPETDYEGMRTFVKITLSNKRFNLLGNSQNYMLDYDWKMYSRDELRNMESNPEYKE